MTEDKSLADTTPDLPADGMFGNPDAPAAAPATVTQTVRQLTVEEVLASARRPREIARICLRADLQAEHSQLVQDLARMINSSGELTIDPEASIGESTAAAVAQEKHARLVEVARLMNESMWHVTFEGMPSDDWPAYTKKYIPKGKDEDDAEFLIRLVADTAVDPELSMDEVRELRKKFGHAAWQELASKAWAASSTGGVNAPKSPISLRVQMGGSSGS